MQIARDIKTKLAEFRNQLPAGVKVANWYDQSELIVSSAQSVRDAIIVGVVFAVLILLLFLRNLKVTLIAAIAVPSVLAATVLLLYVFNMSFNMMTLGGMAAAVGLIIDDAIVMVEHITRRLSEGGALRGARAPSGYGIYQIPRGIVGLDDHHFCAFGVSVRRHRRFFQSAISDDGGQPGYFLRGGVVGGSSADGSFSERARRGTRKTGPFYRASAPDL